MTQLEQLVALIQGRIDGKHAGAPSDSIYNAYLAVMNDRNANEDQRAKAKEAFLQKTMDAPSMSWSDSQKNTVRSEINAVLAQLGYRS